MEKDEESYKNKSHNLLSQGLKDVMKYLSEGDVGKNYKEFMRLVGEDMGNGTNFANEFLETLGENYRERLKLHKTMLLKIKEAEQKGYSKYDSIIQAKNYFKDKLDGYIIRKASKGIKPEDYSKDNSYIDLKDICAKLSVMEKELYSEPTIKDAKTGKHQIVNLKLSDIFQDSSKYQSILDLLKENKYCIAVTNIWQGRKGEYVDIIDHLHKQGYYKQNKKPTHEQVKMIAKNTFSLEIGIDTIKKTKPSQQIQPKFSFIPHVSEIIL